MISIGDFVIESDSKCLTVKQFRQSKGKGKKASDKICTVTLGHFGRFSQACKAISDQICLDGTDAQEILNKQEEMNQILRGFNGDLLVVAGKIQEVGIVKG